LIKSCLAKQALFDYNAPSVRHFHQNMLAQHVGRGPRVGSTVFELDKFRPDELNHLRSQDALVTASKWGAEVFRANGLEQPMLVMPHGVDRGIFNPDVKPSIKFEGNPTVFINVSKKEVRKGHEELIEAFCRAFSPKDNVRLIMHWRNRFYSDEQNEAWDNLYKNSMMGDKIHIVPGFLDSQEEVAGLYASADCGVYPSKAEGFGLGPLELMSCGKQIILTNNTGHKEYATYENSLLIETPNKEPAYDGFWFHAKHNEEWAAIDDEAIDQMVEHLRLVHKTQQENGYTINEEGIKTAKQFTWNSTTKKLTEFLQTL